MSHTDWPTITDANTIASAMGVTFGTAQTAAFTMISESLIQTIKTRTHRTFITITEDRTYDGSDTGRLEVDDYISINTIQLLGFFGNTPGLSLDNFNPVDKKTFPKSVIQVYQGSVPAFMHMWIDRFPAGRSNIKINALWGYDTTIPSDLWLGVNLQLTGMLLNGMMFNTEGWLVKIAEANATEVRQFIDPFKFFGGVKSFNNLIEFYKRPGSYYLRKQLRPLM